MTQKEYEVGARVHYKGSWGKDHPIPGTISGSGEKNEQPVYDVMLDTGAEHWGYADQFTRIVPDLVDGSGDA